MTMLEESPLWSTPQHGDLNRGDSVEKQVLSPKLLGSLASAGC